jgi:hypothetical protein
MLVLSCCVRYATVGILQVTITPNSLINTMSLVFEPRETTTVRSIHLVWMHRGRVGVWHEALATAGFVHARGAHRDALF